MQRSFHLGRATLRASKGTTLRAGSESLRWADGETLRAIPEMAALRVTLLSFAPAAGQGWFPARNDGAV